MKTRGKAWMVVWERHGLAARAVRAGRMNEEAASICGSCVFVSLRGVSPAFGEGVGGVAVQAFSHLPRDRGGGGEADGGMWLAIPRLPLRFH